MVLDGQPVRRSPGVLFYLVSRGVHIAGEANGRYYGNEPELWFQNTSPDVPLPDLPNTLNQRDLQMCK